MRNRSLLRSAGLLVAALFILLAPSPALQAQQPQGKALTVERIYGRPNLAGELLSGVEWSPNGKLISYLHRTGEGAAAKTDIWVLDVATGQERELVNSEKVGALIAAGAPSRGQQTGLGRVAPQRYLWAPGGDALLFVSQGDLYWFDLKTQAPKKLTSAPEGTKSPIEDSKISPDGRWVSFVRDFDLWVVNVAGGQEKRLTEGGREELMNGQLDWVYPEELDIRTAYWWSPDSTQIAYLQMDERPVTKYPLVNYLSYTGEMHTMRYPKAGDANPVVRVGVVAVGGSDSVPAPRWMDLGSDSNIYVARVDWLRDSKRLAIQRLNRAQNRLELLFADAASGRAEVVLTETDKYWVNLHDDLYFFADGRRFLWSSERDGFRHLYLYDAGGKLLKQLTHGNWEVSSLAGVDEKQGVVYFTATQKSPIERHLYSVALDGSGFARISREDGWHSVTLAPDATHYLDMFSTALTPPRRELHRADGSLQSTMKARTPPQLDEYRLQRVDFFPVPGADGTPLQAMMIKPAGFDPSRKYPVIVNLYGGPHGQVVRNAWGGANFLWHQMMAQKGFIIFSVDNRGMAARGHAFEAPIYHQMGKVELADQVAGVNHLKSLPYVDGSRIGIWGWSYGGYMTCTAMLNASDVFKAGFAGAPVTDWRQYDTIYTERYMGLPQENGEGYQQSAPATHAANLKGKLLIAHAIGDDNVHFGNTVELLEKLVQSGHYPEVMPFAGRGHGISDPPARIQIFRRVTQFFLDNL